MIQPSKLIQTYFWEFTQNLPLVAGFSGGIWLWDSNLWAAVGCMIAGSTAGALLIAFTEHKIVAGHREPTQVVVINILSFSTLTLVLVAYLHAGWSNWITDLLVGGCAGLALDRTQSKLTWSPGRHTIAMVGAGGCGIAGIRLLSGTLNWLGSALILTSIVTLIVVLFDYLQPNRSQNHSKSD